MKKSHAPAAAFSPPRRPLKSIWLPPDQLGTPGVAMPEELTIHWFRQSLGEIWIPLLTGSFIIGLFLSVISYFFIDLLWRYTVRKRWKNRPGFNRQS